MIFSRLKTRLNMVTFSILIIASIFVVFYVNYLQKQSALITAEEKSLILLQHNLAIHSYFNLFLKPKVFALTEASLGQDYFDPTCMSSTYAVRNIDHLYRQENGDGYYYKEAAINARSPENEADDFERAFILRLNQDQNLKKLSGVRDFSGKHYFFTLIRGESLEIGCMRCHSTPDKAPGNLLKQYGSTRSFNRSVDETVSAIAIRVPLDETYRAANILSLKLSVGFFFIFLTAFVLKNRMLNHLLLVPLDRFRSQAEAISSHPEELGTTIPPIYTEEMNEIAGSFNKMSFRLKSVVDNLDKTVQERTAALIESENLLKESQTIAGLGSYILDISSGVWETSDVLDKVFGIDAAYQRSVAGWEALIHPDDQGLMADYFRSEVLGKRQKFDKEYRIIRHDDQSERWVHGLGRLEYDPSGNLLKMHGTIQDITAHKELELKLRNTLAEAQRFREALDYLTSYIYIKDTQFRYLYANRSTLELFGCSAEELVGCDDRSFFPPSTVQQLHEIDSRVFSGERTTEEVDVDHAVRGRRVYLEVKTPIYEEFEGRKLLGLLGISTDITERKRAEEELQQAKAAAEAATTAKTQFLANMSHEIRTPMNGMLGMTQLLERTDLSEEQQEYLKAIKLSGKNLLALINDILDLSKIEAGKVTLDPAEFSLQQCLNDIVLMQRFASHEKGLSLQVNYSEEIPLVLVGDQLRVKQILLNLLGNAIKFTKQGGVTIAARLLEQHAESVLIHLSIRDTGIGIAADALDKIFLPFVQEDGSTTRKYGGTGLGLTISRSLAESLGGSIAVESSPGTGSCFTVTLPFAVIREVAPDTTFAAKKMINWDGPRLKILLLEENPVNSSFGASLLKKLGHDVVVVMNGEECLAALHQTPFALVLMDIPTSERNGAETLREIRGMEAGPSAHQPVIALTAYSRRGDRELFLAEGFDGYLSKPLEIKELIAEMKRVIGLSGENNPCREDENHE